MDVIEVSAVVFRDADGRMLLVRKRGTELFMHPGGKPEAGEQAVDAAVREVKEELGVEVSAPELQFLGVFEADAANEPHTRVRAHLYEYTASSAERDVTSRIGNPAAEIAEVRWLNFAGGVELPNDLAPLVTEAILPLYGRRRIASVAVFTGAREGNDPRFVEATRELGGYLADRGITLVYGGGKVGLMGAVADACVDAGGRAVGVIPQSLQDRELGHDRLERLEVVPDMHARKLRMTELSDAFIALPGGAGTLDELFEAWTWQQLGIHSKPIALLDGEYWQPLISMLDSMVAAGLVRSEDRDALNVAESAGEAVAALERWVPPAPKWR